MLNVNECFECNKAAEELYTTDCADGFGPAEYCAECLKKLAKEGFNDEVLTCSCGCRMQLMNEEAVLDIVERDGILCYMCEECEDSGFVGLYVNQPDEIVDQVWEGKVEPDELRHEYIYDLDYALYYHRGHQGLYGRKYIEDWEYLLF